MLSMKPPGYKVAYQAKNDMAFALEMIPEGESLDQWTEMFSVQIIRNIGGESLASFQKFMTAKWEEMCPCVSTEILERGREQGHPTLFWVHKCAHAKYPGYLTGKPENTWFKALLSNGNVVVAQKAFKFEPSAEAVVLWLDFLRNLRVNPRLESLH
ncbi:hypothetical protein X899_2993 [Burkholderia pseudomallei TSV 25]|uniref:hypothetical protein n=1 Tax=Burkholderia pseudomallei TaxID=28450 RepID=UPI00052A296A|nr:hypothetical protein [Burkholderia pseudomallei]AIV49271.1 hypothetical protein X988_767 [Burkholderia pseudomallei TSV 48]KGW09756.1 hypothetical protein X899_2993 [Burkholderia pseudomallei TSV 25]KIX58644.1 hypothetical protein SZ29_09110 [Burkholderia pseudomallei]